MFSDSHCHLDRLDLEPFDGQLAGAIAEAADAGISQILCVGIDLESFPGMLELIEPYSHVLASVGVHPNETKGQNPDVDHLCDLAQHPKVVAIGETGLDYFRSQGDLHWQRERFSVHINAARQTGLPLIVHSREAHDDTAAILSAELDKGVYGVMHCFTYGWAQAKIYLDMGMYISFSGIVTFNSAQALKEVAEKIPLDRMLIETDSPYLAPVPHRGKSNRPAFVTHVAKCIAEIRGVSLEEIASATLANYKTLFGR